MRDASPRVAKVGLARNVRSEQKTDICLATRRLASPAAERSDLKTISRPDLGRGSGIGFRSACGVGNAGQFATHYATARADACNGCSVCPVINFQDVINSDPDVGRLNAFITAIEAQTLEKILDGEYSADGAKSILGEVMIYDRNLSVNGLVACATCHTPQQGFTGGSSLMNQTTVAMVGAVGDRASGRKPMSHA